jgi:hypothetical protein
MGDKRFSPLSLGDRRFRPFLNEITDTFRFGQKSGINKAMLNVREKIKSEVLEALKRLNIEARDFAVEHPENISFGDYSTNVAMALSKSLGKNPFDLASEIAGDFSANLPDFIEKVEQSLPETTKHIRTAMANILKSPTLSDADHEELHDLSLRLADINAEAFGGYGE